MTRSTESGRIMLIRKEFAEDGVLIELYWNVNSLLNAISIFSSPVLIELYWNVNKSKKKKSTTPASVLIELYWNVNRWRKQRMC